MIVPLLSAGDFLRMLLIINAFDLLQLNKSKMIKTANNLIVVERCNAKCNAKCNPSIVVVLDD